MRNAPQNNGHAAWLLALMLVLCLMLFTTLAPLCSAESGTELEGKYLAVAMMQDREDGRVTDDDGLIGNSRDGADRADEPFARDMMPRHATEGGTEATTPAPRTSEAPSDGASTSVLPWIIASLVVLAVVLVALALIPKKKRSH